MLLNERVRSKKLFTQRLSQVKIFPNLSGDDGGILVDLAITCSQQELLRMPSALCIVGPKQDIFRRGEERRPITIGGGQASVAEIDGQPNILASQRSTHKT